MRHWIFVLLTVALMSICGRAQSRADLTAEQTALHTATFQAATKAHQAGRHDEAIAGFIKCLELVAEDDATAYNIACGYSQKHEVDQAFAWLTKAIAWGFGANNLDVDLVAMAEKTDPDLDLLRTDPRFAAALLAIKANAKAVDDYVNAPLFYVPESCKGAQSLGVLVLLHERGSTREELLDSAWKKLADELHLALVLPSGRMPVRAQPRQGMSWFSSLPNYTKSTWKYERTVGEALATFGKLHTLDKQRVFIGGLGQGGMVAFNIAIAAPTTYSGVLVFDSPLVQAAAAPKSAAAAKQGFRGRVYVNTTKLFAVPPGTDMLKYVQAIEKGIASLKLEGLRLSTYELDPAQPEQRTQLALGTLREWLETPLVPPNPPAAK